jgi:hypothetical protein
MPDDTAPSTPPRARPPGPAAAVALCAAALLIGFAAAAGQAVTGRVVDEDRGQGVATAQVSLLRDTVVVRTVLTDSTGAFALPVLRPDTFALRVEHIGYEVVTSRRIDVGRDDVVQVELRVSQRQIPLEPLVVTGRRGAGNARLSEYYDRLDRQEELGGGVLLSRSELERYEGYNVRDALGRAGITFRRSNPFMPCMIRTYWNGMMIESVPDDRWSGSALRDLPVSSVEGVEIYRDRFDIPPEYRHPEVCGVVLVWSRPLRPGEGERGPALLRLLAAVGIFALLTVLAR